MSDFDAFVLEPGEYDDCEHCGGEGWCEVDDPINDDCDEFGYGECRHCTGSGIIRLLPKASSGEKNE